MTRLTGPVKIWVRQGTGKKSWAQSKVNKTTKTKIKRGPRPPPKSCIHTSSLTLTKKKGSPYQQIYGYDPRNERKTLNPKGYKNFQYLLFSSAPRLHLLQHILYFSKKNYSKTRLIITERRSTSFSRQFLSLLIYYYLLLLLLRLVKDVERSTRHPAGLMTWQNMSQMSLFIFFFRFQNSLE